jgi:hypothetical protein
MEVDEEAKAFYGPSYGRGNGTLLNSAYKTFKLACNSSVDSIRERAINLAAKKEQEAFAA